MISLNQNVMPKVRYLIDHAEQLGCRHFRLGSGAHIIDMGVEEKGGFEAGRLFAEITMADLATCHLKTYTLSEDVSVMAVEIYTAEPILACLCSQIGGYPLSSGDFAAIGSGPGRAKAALAIDHSFQYTDYRDNSDEVVFGIQANQFPDEGMVRQVGRDCRVRPENIYFLAHKTSSIVASIQVAARILEQTINKMIKKGFDLNTLAYARGSCLVAPVDLNPEIAMGKINDSLLYGGRSEFWVKWDDQKIQEILPQLVTESSRDYGRLFRELFIEAGRDFYKMDLDIHSPAAVQIVNMNSGRMFKAGRIREDLIKKSFFNLN
ncbi:MAG TPA: methenyltetrahydromethanopterin cyclohydrolase [Anaerolineales bacterium]|nr:methenyltetrahydromethanopterin cyclohydrolase [Anaerolineales bacterium]